MEGNYIVKLLGKISEIMMQNKEYLIELDSVVGDGDLGLTMSDGFAAAYKTVALSENMDAGNLLYFGGKAMSTAVPSTMGTLMASGLMNAGKALKGVTDINLPEIAKLFEAFMEGVSSRGKAKIGDKTFLDGIAPAVAALNKSAEAGEALEQAAQKAADAAQAGFQNTKNLIAVHGRAATRGEASRALLDPGAAVAMLMMKGLVNSTK